MTEQEKIAAKWREKYDASPYKRGILGKGPLLSYEAWLAIQCNGYERRYNELVEILKPLRDVLPED